MTLAAAVIANAHTYLWYKNRFPYGPSHCCLKAIGLSLRLYSRDNDDRFPSGGPTPEASLSMLLPSYCDLNTLKGKTVKLEAAKAALDRDGVLDSNSCGWIYVEGLNESDSPEMPILWDRVPGLGHNGQRIRDNGREVLFVDGHTEWISGARWADFLSRQQTLRDSRPEWVKKGITPLAGKIRLPSGEMVDQFRGRYELRYGNRIVGGDELNPSTLRWSTMDCSNCAITFTLTLEGMRSKPVDVTVSNWWPSTNSIIFEMERTE